MDKKQVILVVDDEPDILELAKAMLGDLGYDVIVAQATTKALEIIAARPIDLLLTDVVMPGKQSGFDLAQRARQLVPGLKVLCTSGFTSALDVGQPVMPKPWNMANLTREIARALAS